MSRSKSQIDGIILTHEVRTLLSGEEICRALARHHPKKRLSTFRTEKGQSIVVVTEDSITRVMLQKP